MKFIRDIITRIKLYFLIREVKRTNKAIADAREEDRKKYWAKQKRSFVYGNCNISNENVTREMVEKLDK